MLFKKGVGNKLFAKNVELTPLFRKAGGFLSDVSPVLGMVNPALGVGAKAAGSILTKA